MQYDNMTRIHQTNSFIGRWARRSPAGFALHTALLLILIGACVTHFFGVQGEAVVSPARVTESFISDEGASLRFPFSLRLADAQIECHEGTTAPKDFVAELLTEEGSHRLSMNHVLELDGYRLCLKKFDGDNVTLGVNHDPWGIAISYAGYYLLFAATLWIFGRRAINSLQAHRAAHRAALAILTLCSTLPSMASQPADAFGEIRVYWGDRPAAMETMSRNLLTRVYGSAEYQGMPATEVLLGWLFDYDRWMREPIIKVKGEHVREAIGIDGKYAAYSDFFSPEGYKLEPLLTDLSDKDAHAADERVKLMSAWCAGQLMKIYPYRTASGRWEWLTPVDSKPSQMPLDQWKFVSTSFNDVARNVSLGNPDGAARVFRSIGDYQTRQLPSLSAASLRAELIYIRFGGTLAPGIFALIAGIALIIFKKHTARCKHRCAVSGCAALLWLWLSALIAVRWYICGHFPLANGFETMQALAWIAATCAIFGSELFLLVAGLALMVCTMGGGNTLSPLLPVLASPLLSVHVLLVMTAYCLAAMICINSAIGAFGPKERAARRLSLSMRFLEPTVLLLACGIFVGAIWANMSWGRYWGWDPKETWALITMIIYAVPLHTRWIPPLRGAKAMNRYLALAFISVLITYFGVNFFMTGLHSYA